MGMCSKSLLLDCRFLKVSFLETKEKKSIQAILVLTSMIPNVGLAACFPQLLRQLSSLSTSIIGAVRC